MANINYTTTGNATDAERAVERLQARFEKLEEKLANQARNGKRRTQESVSGFKQRAIEVVKYAAGFLAVERAVSGARAIFNRFMQDHQRLLDLQQQISETIPEVEIRARLQGRLDDSEFEQFRKSTNEKAIEIPVTPLVDAFRAQEELTSQGFERKQIIGGEALESLRRLQLVTNQFGVEAEDSKSLIRALSTSIRNQEGRDSTAPLRAEDIDAFTTSFVALFEARPIQLRDAIPFARIQSVLNQRGIDQDTQLAAFTVALQALGSGDVAAVSLEQTTAFLKRSGTKTIKSKLKKQGLDTIDTSEFDLIGETLDVALENLQRQLKSLTAAQQTELLQTLFGSKTQKGVLALANGVEDLRRARNEIQSARTNPALVADRVQDFDDSTFAFTSRGQIIEDQESRKRLENAGDFTGVEASQVLDTVNSRLSRQGDIVNRVLLSTRRKIADEIFSGAGARVDAVESLGDVKIDGVARDAVRSVFDQFFGVGVGQAVDGLLPHAGQEDVITREIQKVLNERAGDSDTGGEFLAVPLGFRDDQLTAISDALKSKGTNSGRQRQIEAAAARIRAARDDRRQRLPNDTNNVFDEQIVRELQKADPRATTAQTQFDINAPIQLQAPVGITRDEIIKATQSLLQANPEASGQIIQAEGRLQTSRVQVRPFTQDPTNPFEEQILAALQPAVETQTETLVKSLDNVTGVLTEISTKLDSKPDRQRLSETVIPVPRSRP